MCGASALPRGRARHVSTVVRRPPLGMSPKSPPLTIAPRPAHSHLPPAPHLRPECCGALEALRPDSLTNLTLGLRGDRGKSLIHVCAVVTRAADQLNLPCSHAFALSLRAGLPAPPSRWTRKSATDPTRISTRPVLSLSDQMPRTALRRPQPPCIVSSR